MRARLRESAVCPVGDGLLLLGSRLLVSVKDPKKAMTGYLFRLIQFIHTVRLHLTPVDD